MPDPSWSTSCASRGPNRIGQGIEFDYCCVQAALALRDRGYETIMVNCNSGDSACCLPPHRLSAAVQDVLRRQTEQLAMALGVVGLINIQFAIRGEEVFVLEVNPRACRTVPFVSKATGLPLARLAAECMMGRPLADQGVRERAPVYWSVKEAVFPFIKLPGVDTLLGPEMKSTGEGGHELRRGLRQGPVCRPRPLSGGE